jgi:hypothetical protein
MLKLIKAELYKTFNRAYYYVFICCTVFFIGSLYAGIYLTKVPITVYNLMAMGVNTLKTPVFLILMIVSTITNEEIKEKTLRNTLSFGVSRNSLYMAKLITSIILATISAVIILAVFVGGAYILFKPGSELTPMFVKDFFLRILYAVPMYTAAIAISALLGFVIKSEMVYAFSYLGLFVAVKPVIQLLCYFISDKFIYIYNILISTRLSMLGDMKTGGIDSLTTVILGIAYTVIFTAIGIVVFRRQEVK